MTRLENFEVSNTEQPRLHKLLQVTLTDLQIDNDEEDLESQITEFMQVEMKNERKEVDSNIVVTKGKRDNKVIVKLSHIKLKLFLHLCKVYRETLDETASLCILTNDFFHKNSSYRYETRAEKAREEGVLTFESVYSFEGRLYA